jgi:PKD repeat protein
MRKLLISPLFALLLAGCDSSTPVGPGVVIITETTTSTSTSTTTTSTIPEVTKAKFVFSPITPQEVQPVNFNGAASTPGTDRRIVSYAWDFGDGVMKTGITSTHDFYPTGIYLVTLTVTDDSGFKATDAQPITVRPKPPEESATP